MTPAPLARSLKTATYAALMALAVGAMAPAAAEAEPLRVLGLQGGSRLSPMRDQMATCQDSPERRGQVVCSRAGANIGGVPATVMLLSFQDDRLFRAQLVLPRPFTATMDLLQQAYGPPAERRSTAYTQDNGSPGIIHFGQWVLDDGTIEVGAAEGAGQELGSVIQFIWNR